jgi:hypothetical protein
VPGLTNPPGFGTNSYDEDYWATAQKAGGPRFVVRDPQSWVPTVNTAAPRSVVLSAGGAWHCGVWDQTAAIEVPPAFAANGGATDRWDALVSRADWTAHTRTFVTIPGTTAPPSVNATQVLSASQINRIAAERYDGLVALVRIRPGVGTLSPADIIDCRTWFNGSTLTTPSEHQFLTHLDMSNGSLLVAETTNRVLRRSPSSWVPIEDNVPDTGWQEMNLAPGWTKHLARYRVRDGWFQFSIDTTRTSWAQGDLLFTVPAGYRPSTRVYCAGMYFNALKEVQIVATTGEARMAGGSGTTGVVVSGNYPI